MIDTYCIVQYIRLLQLSHEIFDVNGHVSLSSVNSVSNYQLFFHTYINDKSEKITLWTDQSNKPAIVGGYNFTFPWERPIQNLTNYFISIEDYKYSGINRFLSFDVDIIGPTATLCKINFNPVNTQIISITFRVTTISSGCSSSIEILKPGTIKIILVYNFVVLNLNSRPVATTGSNEEQYPVFSSKQFVFNSNLDFKIFHFISSLQVSYVPPTKSQQIIALFNKTQLHTSNFIITIRSQSNQQNLITSIKLGIIILSLRAYPSFSYYKSTTSITNLINDFNYNFGIPTEFSNRSNFTSMCIYGNNRFKHDMIDTTAELKLIQTDNVVTNIFMDKIDQLHFNTLCLMQCQGGFGVSNSSTYYCLSFVANCLYYDIRANCITCKENYILISPTYCQPCGGDGNLVQGGCTTIPGCTAVTKSTEAIYPTICTACNGQQYYLDSNNQCSCLTGWIVTGLCTNNYGCLTTKRSNNQIICLACAFYNKFVLKNNSCQCFQGYTLNDSNSCEIVCGDGKVLTEQKCDDGNLIDGDGCSSICKMEPFYICLNGSLTHPSQCFYDSSNLVIQYSQAQKIIGQNSGILTFKIKPSIIILNRMNMLSLFVFHCDSTYSVNKWIVSEGLIKMYIDYSQDLEGKDGAVNFIFDSAFVKHGNMSITFNIKSKNSKLVVIKSPELIQMVANLCNLLAWAALSVFLISSFSHKMIGVQSLHVFQIIYFIHLSNTVKSQPYSKIKSLALVLANTLYLQNKAQNLNIFTYSNQVIFQFWNAERTIFLLVIVLCSPLVLFVLLTLLMNKFKILQKVRLFLYHNYLFPFSIGFSIVNYLIVLSLSTINSEFHNYFYLALNSLCILTICLITYLIGFHEWIYLFSDKPAVSNRFVSMLNCSQAYIPTYLTFNLIHILLISLTKLSYFNFYCQSVIGLTLIMIIWQLKQSPYRSKVHNLGIFINQIIVLSFAVWSKMRQYNSQLVTENNQNLMLFIFIFLLYFSLAYAILRVLKQIFDRFCKKQKQQKKRSNKKQKSKIFVDLTNETSDDLDLYLKKMNIINPYSLQKIKGQQILSKWKFQNKIRLINGCQSLFNQNDLTQKQKLLNDSYLNKFSTELSQNQYSIHSNLFKKINKGLNDKK